MNTIKNKLKGTHANTRIQRKHHIYTHHLTIPYRPLETDDNRSCNPTSENDNLITATTYMPSKHYSPVTIGVNLGILMVFLGRVSIDAAPTGLGFLLENAATQILKKYPSK